MSALPPGPWVEDWLSAPRFATYLRAAAGDRRHALDLYEWNATMAGAIFHDLAHVEVALRNAYDRALSSSTPGRGTHWTDFPARLFPPRPKRAKDGTVTDANETPRNQITYAKGSAGRGAAPGKVVAELTFGFWRYLSTASHEVPLWRPYLHRGFQYGTARRTLDDAVARLHQLRNRVAHHEPLITANLNARHGDVLLVSSLIDADLKAYVAQASTWSSVLAQRP